MIDRSVRRKQIPEPTIARLPIYQRITTELLRGGQTTVSSDQLGRLAGVTAAKVRKDLSSIGSLGTRGSGYDAAALVAGIAATMGAGETWRVAIVGVGNLGRALINTRGFLTRRYDLAALIDSSPELLGTTVAGVVVSTFDEAAASLVEPVDIGVLTLPAHAAQGAADQLIGLGAHSILNFAPAVLSCPPEVRVRYVDLSIELQVLSHYARSAEVGRGGLLSSVGIQPTTAPASADARGSARRS